MSWFAGLINKKAKTGPGGGPGAIRPVKAVAAVWCVGGGKGGVGKSLVAANMAILLTRLGHRVLLVDADLGAANLHTFLALEGSGVSLSNFLKGETEHISSVIEKTRIPNLELVSGARDSLDIANVKEETLARLKSGLKSLDYDYVLLDIGPGTTSNMLDLFLLGDEGVLLTTPEPTSIENTYRFLKCLFLHRMKQIMQSQEDGRIRELLMRIFSSDWSSRIKTLADIIKNLRALDPNKGEALERILGRTRVSVIVNQARRPEDGDLGPSIKKACRDFFNVEIRHLGNIRHDEKVTESIRLRSPLVLNFRDSAPAQDIESCMQELMKVRTVAMHPGMPELNTIV